MPECIVCTEVYNSTRNVPKILGCGHTLCVICIQQLWDRNQRTCPIDRTNPINVPGGLASNLPTNYALLEERNPSRPQSRMQNVQPLNIQPPFVPASAPIPVTSPEPEIIIIDNTVHHSGDDCENLPLCKLAKKIGDVMKHAHDAHDTVVLCLALFYLIIIGVCRLVAGAVKLSSECDKEQLVAIYLFVKFWVATVFWLVVVLLQINDKVRDALKHWAFHLYLFVDLLFSLIWLFVGTHWLWTNFPNIVTICALVDIGWSQHFINFAVFLHCIDWIALLLVVAYFCFKICKINCDCDFS